MKKIPIVEVFATIQGEGYNLGVPSVFVRVGGCDLRCRFKGISCDTPYAVHTPSYLEKNHPELKYGYNTWHLTEVAKLVHIIKAEKLKNIVFSGGHPLLYQEELITVIDQLTQSDSGYTFEFETQGTIPIDPFFRFAPDVIFNVSVKLKSSNQEEGYNEKRISTVALLSFPKDTSYYKFVISDPEQDLKEIKEILEIRRLPVYVMPEGLTREDVLKASPAVVKLAIENNFRFSPREHINIWDTLKGK
jgi:organic radical activating enzyme